MSKTYTYLLVAVLLSAFLVGCSSAKEYSSQAPQAASNGKSGMLFDSGGGQRAMEESMVASDMSAMAPPMAPAAEAPAPMPEPATVTSNSNSNEVSKQDNKIIITANVGMSTDNYDNVSSTIRNITANSGGYVQDSIEQYINTNISYRVLSITLRVPSESYSSIISQIKELGTVTNLSENQENVTQQYYDIKSRLDMKQIEEERVLDLIGKATSIDDILKLEEMLGRIRTDIEVYQTQMTSLDRLSSYSTIYLSLTEVLDETAVIMPTNFGDKLQDSFIKSLNNTLIFLENALVWVVGLFVPLVVILVAASIISILFRLFRVKKKND